MYIYKLTNKTNGMGYIGATIQPFEQRLRGHFDASKTKRNTLLAQAIREFGLDNFSSEILRYARNSHELMYLEIQAIKAHGTLAPAGYNMTSGGKGTMDHRLLESTKLLISQKAKGRICSEETKAKLSAALKGKTQPWNKGKRTGPPWNKGIPHTPEAHAKMIASHVGKREHNARRIEMYGTVYESISDAARQTGFSRMQVKYRLATGRAKYLEEKVKTGRVPTNAKPVEFKGKIYGSLLDAARENKTSTTLVRYYISIGQSRYLDSPEKGTTKEKDKQ